MKQPSAAVLAAHKRSMHNRGELARSRECGCFYFGSVFAPSMVSECIDNDDTALCPRCGIDSVIGDKSGFPITVEFLNSMRDRWFGEEC
jgi:hypothetical protein